MSHWLFNTFIDGCMSKMKANMGNVGARLKMNWNGWAVVACLFADNTILFAEWRGIIEWWMNLMIYVLQESWRWMLGKKKLGLWKKESRGGWFNRPYRVCVTAVGRCEVVLGENIESESISTVLPPLLHEIDRHCRLQNWNHNLMIMVCTRIHVIIHPTIKKKKEKHKHYHYP